MQTLLNRLVVYARSQHLTINTSKSEVVHFNSKRGAQVPTFMLAGTALKCSEKKRKENYANSKKLLTSTKDKGPLGKSPFTRKEESSQ